MIKAYDLHANIGVDKVYGFSQTPEELLKKMEIAQVEKAVLQPIPSNQEEIPAINDYVAGVTKKYPNKFVGFCCVDPNDPRVTNEIDRAVNELGLKGILLDYDTFLGVFGASLGAPKTWPVFEKAREYNIPILIQSIPGMSRYLGDNLAEDINTVCERFPDVTIIAHILIPAIKYFFVKNSNLLLDTANNLDNRAIEGFTGLIGAGRIFFGSNSPKEHPLVRRLYIDDAEITEYQKELILRKNLARLLRI